MSVMPNWKAATDETVRHLTRLIQAPSVNPPGDEELAIQVIQEILENEGLTKDTDFTIIESSPRRANLVARLRGNGSARPLLLSGHVDVVPVERQNWSRDPFCGEIVNGEIWGRGALDMKGFLAMYLQIFLLLHRRQQSLKRDIIFAAVADEKNRFTYGSKFLVEQHRSLIDAEYAFTKGGGFTLYVGKRKLYMIQISEKGYCWVRMRSNGSPGHAGLYNPNNAITHLAHGLECLRKTGLPVHLTPTWHSLLQAASEQVSLGEVLSLLRVRLFVKMALRLLPPASRALFTTMVSNTVTPTKLEAGRKINVVPSTAQAVLDCRTLPGQSFEDLCKEMRSVVGDGYDFDLIDSSQGAQFSMDTDLYRLLEHEIHQLDPEGIVIPFMLPGMTDACQYQKAGITVYGFTPGFLPPDFPTTILGHGQDERLPVSFIESGLPVLWNVITQFCQ